MKLPSIFLLLLTLSCTEKVMGPRYPAGTCLEQSPLNYASYANPKTQIYRLESPENENYQVFTYYKKSWYYSSKKDQNFFNNNNNFEFKEVGCPGEKKKDFLNFSTK